MICPDCQTNMKNLFFLNSFYCPNDCDKKENTTALDIVLPEMWNPLSGTYKDGEILVMNGLYTCFFNSKMYSDNKQWELISGIPDIKVSTMDSSITLYYQTGDEPLIFRVKQS